MNSSVHLPAQALIAVAIICLIGNVASATSYQLPDPPADPTVEALLKATDLHEASEAILLSYVEKHWRDEAGAWIPLISKQENEELGTTYIAMLEQNLPGTRKPWEDFANALTKRRLKDKRRVLDAVVRHLGQTGTQKSLTTLIGLAKYTERNWVSWKALASIIEILPRTKPETYDFKAIREIDPNVVAPLLGDLDDNIASEWAWFLQERWKKTGGSYRAKVPLATRLRLAKAYFRDHPEEAKVVFDEGFNSHDVALRTLTEFFIRDIVGGSIAYQTPPEKLTELLLASKPRGESNLWDILPPPLASPFLHEHARGRTDLIFLNKTGFIDKEKEDVFPQIKIPLPNGLFYSRIGESYSMVYGLSDEDGRIYSRVSKLHSRPVLCRHGGLVALTKNLHISESDPTGKVIWQCRLEESSFSYRYAVPYEKGTFLLLAYGGLECRNRRGEILWSMRTGELDDVRGVKALDTDRFLVSCTNSVGILTRDGEYEVLVSGTKSAREVRYHPTESWVIDGGDSVAIIIDPQTHEETGRFDLNASGLKLKSRFSFPDTDFPE